MTTQPADQSKRCSRCGRDVSNRTRATDAQGNYICAECLEEARTNPAAAAPAAAATARPTRPRSEPGSDDIMSKLVDESIQEAKSGCPNCRAKMKANQVICVKCGYHREKGEALHTTVQKPKVIKDKSTGKAALESVGAMAVWLVNPWVVLGIPIALFAGTFLLAQQDPEKYAPFFILSVILVWILATVVLILEAYQDGIVHVLLCLFFPFYCLYYVWVESDNGALKLLYVVNLAAAIAVQFVLPATGG